MTRVETYEQAVEFLFTRINYERVSGASYSVDDFRLDRMRTFLDRLGNPHSRVPVVHVAGTKGKGSTAAMIAGVLTAAGFRTGLFTSPHISVFEERMAVDGAIPTSRDLVELVNALADTVAALDKTPGAMSPTYFEIATAMAWLFFQQRQVQIAVLEVGLGGRLDATNVCHPEVTVITTISRDHTRQLGSRLEQITREKAGIIKPGIPLVSGVTAPAALSALDEECRQGGAPRYQLRTDDAGVRMPECEFGFQYHPPLPGVQDPDSTGSVDVRTGRGDWCALPLPMPGAHQAHNVAVAVAALERLIERGWNIPESAVRTGLSQVRWPGRIEVLSRRPAVIVDVAHNWAAVAALLKTLDEQFPARRRVLVFAATRDKDVAGMLRQLLPRFDSVILTCYQNNPRGVPVEELSRLVQSLTAAPAHLAADTVAAWKLARRIATPDDLICITGSFFIAAELRELILDESRQGAARSAEVTALDRTGSPVDEHNGRPPAT